MSSSRRRTSRGLASKYSTYKRYVTSTEVSYGSHTARSSYEKEASTEYTSARGVSSSTKEIVAGSETRSLPVYIAIEDYAPPEPKSPPPNGNGNGSTPRATLTLDQGQIVEVLDNKNPAAWLVRTKARPPQTGWVPGSYFETPSEYYSQRRRTREIDGSADPMTPQEEALAKRDLVYDELLSTEDEFVRKLQHLIETYVKLFDSPQTPAHIRHLKDQLTLNLRELYNFHANVLLKGLQYYADDPSKVGQTFVRLERDFDHHVRYCQDVAAAEKLLNESPAKEFFQEKASQIESGEQSLTDLLKLPRERLLQYQQYLKEFVKYSSRAEMSTKSLQKALELMLSVPQRANDMGYLRNIQEYPGDVVKLGRLLRHELFYVWEGEKEGDGMLRYVFLFKNRLLLTEKIDAEDPEDPPEFKHVAVIRLDKYNVKASRVDDDIFVMASEEADSPTYLLRPANESAAEYAQEAWIQQIEETKQAIVATAEEEDNGTETGTEFVDISDVRSEFSEYSTVSRKSSNIGGPDGEGPPRKKTKSPPAISPSTSSQSIYSGSSDMTGTGTTLEMQGTRVTRTQYGFRTLQESSAKMCLKVTGYPLPLITWFKDDVQLEEDGRHTFFADNEGFFSMTIDPVKVDDTGRYTCVATNEYGQANTSAFFRVLKIEKEPAPPKFASSLADQEIVEGAAARFDCEVEGWPEPELVWLVDGQALHASHDFRMDYDGQKASLEIRDAQPEDSGVYSVRISNELGSDESQCRLEVATDPDKNRVPPEFQQKIEDVEVDEGETARFKAVLTGDPLPEVSWFVNGGLLTESEKLQMIAEDGVYMLTIRDVSRHFDGEVTCRAINRLGEETCTARLTVRIKPLPPKFDKELQDRQAVEFKGTTFEAVVSGYPEPDVSWWLDGTQLQSNQPGVVISYRDDGTCKLELANVQPDQAGKVACKAENDSGSAQSEAMLTVVSEPVEEEVVQKSETAEEEVVPVQAVPDTEAAQKSDDVEERKAEETPQETQAEETQAEETPEETPSEEDEAREPSLQKDEVKETQAEVEPAEDEESEVAPQIEKGLADQDLESGDSLECTVIVSGTPAPAVTWFLNGKQLADGKDGVKLKSIGDGKFQMTRENLNEDDNGTISCTARNSAGKAATAAQLTVAEPKQKPEFTKKLEDVEFSQDDEMTFTVCVTGIPEPTVNWSLNGRKLSDKDGITQSRDGDTYSLSFPSATLEQAGNLTCKATNEAGSCETTGEISVLPVDKTVAPQFTGKLSDCSATEGESVKFTASVTGEPQPDIIWSINDSPVDSKSPGIKIRDEDGLLSLEIDSVSLIQVGRVTCKASNPAGSAETSADLDVSPSGEPPTFTKTFDDQMVEERSAVAFEVAFTGNPTPEIVWLLKGEPLQDGVGGVHITTGDDTSQLSIEKSTLQMVGEVTCRASNTAGSAEAKAHLAVVKWQAQHKPKFQTPMAEINLSEGDTLKTKLLISGAPEPKVKWTINDQLVVETEDVDMVAEDGVYTLAIRGVGTNMTGTIKCTAYNKMGEASTSAPITVIAPVPVEFEQALSDATCREGDTLRLKAVLLGEPTPEVTWFINDNKLEESKKVKINSNSGTYAVTIKDITLDYSGTVLCKAVNEYGEACSAARLIVLPRGQPPDFTEWLSNVAVREGSPVQHRVVFVGDPRPTLTWFINEQPVDLTDTRFGVVTADGVSTLSISSFAAGDIGEVVCKAENDAGEVSCTAQQRLFDADAGEDSEGEVALAEDLMEDDATDNAVSIEEDLPPEDDLARVLSPIMAPKFLVKIKDASVKKGGQAHFECVVPESKGVCVKWLKDGKEIELIARIRVMSRPTSQGHLQQELVIDDVNEEDIGRYSCLVSNELGEEECTAQLELIDEVAPEFIRRLSNVEAEEGMAVRLECRVVGLPAPIVHWYLDGRDVPAAADTATLDDGTLVLSFKSVESSLTGTYKCVAENDAGKDETEAQLKVIPKAMAPTFEKELQSVTRIESEEVEMICRVDGQPTPECSWTKDGLSVEKITTISIETESTSSEQRLLIRKCSKGSAGEFKCTAVNTAGSAETTATLTVKPKPKVPEFTKGLKQVKVKEGEEAVMECAVSGEPRPEVKWTKDGAAVGDSATFESLPDGTERLILPTAAVDDAGEYAVELKNSEGTAKDEAELQVKPKSVAPSFTKGLKSASVKEGESVAMECKVAGQPRPSAKWTKDGEPLDIDGTHVRTESTPDGTERLIIDESAKDDAAKYEITLSNDAGEDSSAAPLTVEPKSTAPSFEEGLKRASVDEGEAVVLECKVSGEPRPSIQWTKDGETLPIDGTHVRTESTPDGTERLLIDEAAKDDAADYGIELKNEAGDDTSSAPLAVKRKSVAPSFEKGLKSTSVKEGDEVSMECKVAGEPRPLAKWTKDGEPLDIDGVHVRTESTPDGTERLLLDAAAKDDAADYGVELVNDAGKDTSSAPLTVQPTAVAPTFTKQLSTTRVDEGDSVVLECCVAGQPKPEVSWTKDGAEVVTNGGRIAESLPDGTERLRITAAARDDAGEYIVRLVSPAGAASSKAPLAVDTVVAPSIDRDLEDAAVEVGAPAHLECAVSGKPKPDVQWLKDGEPVTSNDHVQLAETASGVCSLDIDKADDDDVGKYSCVATNKRGTAESAAKLDVKQPEVNEVDDSGQTTAQSAPEFTKPLTSCEVTDGEVTELSCVVAGEPTPEVKWFKDDEPITSGEGVVIACADNGRQTLTLAAANLADGGTYTCKAVNTAGSAETEALLEVLHAIQVLEAVQAEVTGDLPPVFVRSLESASVDEGDTVVLECAVEGQPPPDIRWLKDGAELMPDKFVSVESLDDGTQRLVIKQSREDDVGSYQCEATNLAGTASTECDVAVTVAAEIPVSQMEQVAPEFVEILRGQEVGEENEVQFECKVAGSPMPKIKWYKDAEEVVPDGKDVRVESLPDGTQRLKIKSATESSIGEYRCEAVNPAGSTWTEAPLTVHLASTDDTGVMEGVAPDFVEALRSHVADEGETVVLECRVTGEPTPEIRWFKDGKEQAPDGDVIRVETEPDGTQRLIVKTAEVADTGEYRCEATNPLGVTWSDGTLDVKVAEQLDVAHMGQVAPEFVRVLEAQSVGVGDSVEMECCVAGQPAPRVQWYRDHEPVDSDGTRVTVESLPDGTQRLRIDDALQKDAGEYRCEATNEAGTAWTDGALNIQFAEQMDIDESQEKAPSFDEELRPCHAQEGDSVALECRVTGLPRPTVQWFRDGVPIGDGDDGATIEADDDGTHRLVIPAAKAEDQGNYRAEATNVAGSMSSKAPLTVSVAEEMELDETDEGALVRGLDTEEPILSKADEQPVEASAADSSASEIPSDVDVKEGVTAPKIKRGLTDTTAPAGSKLQLEIEVEGKPKLVKWYKGGEELTPDKDSRVKLSQPNDKTYQLEIDDLNPLDANEFRVVAENDAGSADSDAKLTVLIPDDTLRLVKGLEDTEVTEAENCQLQVEVAGKPRVVKWYKNGREIKREDRMEVKAKGACYQLCISKSRSTDAGTYKVVLENDAGEITSEAALTVVQPPAEPEGVTAPKIKRGLTDTTAPAGSKLQLEIEVEGKPKQVRWYKGGAELTPDKDSRVKLSQPNDKTYRLEIDDLNPLDANEFRVVAENDAGSADSAAKLTVLIPDDTLKLVKGLEDVEITESDDCQLEVEVTGKPRVVKWYKNGREIKPDDRVQVKAKGASYQLCISKSRSTDAGTYKVVLENDTGEVTSEAALTVVQPAAEPEGVTAPKIKRGLTDTTAPAGSKLQLEIEVEGKPKQVRWYKGGAELTPDKDSRVKLSQPNDKTYRLEIDDLNPLDANEFRVVAENDAGSADSAAKLTVLIPDEKLELLKGLDDLSVTEKEDCQLQVEVSGKPRVVKWYKNGREIKLDDRVRVKEKGACYQLCITKSRSTDAGTYKVVLENDAGEVTSEAALTVVEAVAQLTLQRGLEDVNVTEDENVQLTVQVTGKPKIVKWYRNGRQLTSDDRTRISCFENSGRYFLDIAMAKESDAGTYRVELSDDKTEISSESNVGVHAKAATSEPELGVAAAFLLPLKDQQVTDGDSLTLKVQVTGIPTPDIVWEKDGHEIDEGHSRYRVVAKAEGVYLLKVDASAEKDAGKYTCVVRNSFGAAHTAGTVTVVEKKEAETVPVFVIPLSSATVTEGKSIVFEIKVRAKPTAQLKWLKDGLPLETDDRVTVEDMSDGRWRLTVHDAQPSDAGQFSCEATNSAGSVSSDAHLKVQPTKDKKRVGDDNFAPVFNVPLRDRRIVQGDLASVECHVNAKPVAEIKWYKEGVELESNDRITITNTSDGKCRLEIAKFDEDDVAMYKCVARNELGQSQTMGTLNIDVLKQEDETRSNEFAPRFSPNLSDERIKVGDQLSLECRVRAIPDASVTWFKDGIPLKSNGRTKIEFGEDGTCRLAITDATASDEGAYRCVATNALGSTNSACLVTVQTEKEEKKREGSEPQFIKGLTDAWLDKGDDIILKCAVTGDPEPSIAWYKDGMLLRASDRIHTERQSDGTCVLHIRQCTLTDEGMYRCVATNPLGSATSMATAHVSLVPEKRQVTLKDGEVPRFITGLEDGTFSIDSTLEMEVKVTGVPEPDVKWSKDGAPLVTNNGVSVDSLGDGKYRLTILKATVHDEGTYRCIATNAAGSATTKSFLGLDEGGSTRAPTGADQAPRFVVPLSDARAVEGKSFQLEGKIEGIPEPEITWYKDGEQLIPNDRVKSQLLPDGTVRLWVSRAQPDDEGTYRCLARNAAGSAQQKVAVSVRGAWKSSEPGAKGEADEDARAPRLIVPLENQRRNEGSGLSLLCKFSGKPKPTYKWFKDGERLYPFGRNQVSEHPDGTIELTIRDLTRPDGGAYRCVAENDYGADRTIAEVTVDLRQKRSPSHGEEGRGYAPGFTKPVTVQRILEGTTAVFECLPYGNPFPQIKWLKDGIELVDSDRIKVESLDDGTQKVTITDVSLVDDGFYRCVASNAYGTVSTKAEMIVEADPTKKRAKVPRETDAAPEPRAPWFTRRIRNQTVQQGTSVEMEAVANGNPTPTIRWFKDGAELKADDRTLIWQDEWEVQRLLILNACPEDAAEYKCEATNTLGVARTEASITVLKHKEISQLTDMNGVAIEKGGINYPPGFLKQLKNKHTFSGMPVVLDCLVRGLPTPEVEWYHNGKKVVASDRVRIQQSHGGSHALVIMSAVSEDMGEYVAVATNSLGSASSSAVMDVTVPRLDSIKFEGAIDVSRLLSDDFGIRKTPYAGIPPGPDRGPFIAEATGHYLTLSWIPTRRAPPRYPQVTYVVEIRELPYRDWHVLEYNVPEPVCKVRNLELGKSYQFRVRAENIYGISDPSPSSPPSQLMAKPQPVMDRNKRPIPISDPYIDDARKIAHADQYACAPYFAPTSLSKVSCAEHGIIEIVFFVSGYPDPQISWKFRGWDIDTAAATSKFKISCFGGNECVLRIQGFQKQDAGQYQCFAKNQHGEAQQNVIIELAQMPSFIQPLSNKTVSSDKTVRLDCRVDGSPSPDIKWLKDWHPVVESRRVKLVREEPYLCTLLIEDPILRDTGIYSCVATNEAGSSTTSATLTIESNPDDYDVQIQRRKVTLLPRKVREFYEITEEVQKGPLCSVHRLVERATGRTLLGRRVCPELHAQLKREIDLRNFLWHPHVAALYDACLDADGCWLIFENADSTLLDHATKSDVIDEDVVALFIGQLLLAVEHLHAKNIVHLDIKPENIMVADGMGAPHVKLVDFGYSRKLRRTTPIHGTMGAPEFSAPEVVKGEPVSLASDMWSVGALAYVLLSGVSPFLGDNDSDTLENVASARWSFGPDQFDKISNDAKDFITQLLDGNAKARLNVNQALDHPWMHLASKAREKHGEILSTQALREFKYRHQWVERRVFVQQTEPDKHELDALVGRATEEPECTAVKHLPPLPMRSSQWAFSPRESAADQTNNLLQKSESCPQVSDTGARADRMAPLDAVGVARREIEQEIANRILSDISEEGSVGTDDPRHLTPRPDDDDDDRCSRSPPHSRGTPVPSEPRASTVDEVPVVRARRPSPLAADLSRLPPSMDDQPPKGTELAKPAAASLTVPLTVECPPNGIPTGAPVVIEPLHEVTVQAAAPMARPKSVPIPISPKVTHPSGKSPVSYSPPKEVYMEVIMGLKRGKQEVLPSPEVAHAMPEPQRAVVRTHAHRDPEFEQLLEEVERIKQDVRRRREEILQAAEERDRLSRQPPEVDFDRPDMDFDDFDWASNYQIGPETYLLALRDPDLSSRVRDYRRELWGDSATIVELGPIGFRNRDISVRERRRYTDVVREEPSVQKSVSALDSKLWLARAGAVRRARSDANVLQSAAAGAALRPSQQDGAAPLFQSRLKDTGFVEDMDVTLHCTVVGDPRPDVSWFWHESVIEPDERHAITFERNTAKLTIRCAVETDAGIYSCSASNSHGTSSCSARLKLEDLPERPSRPNVELASDTEVFIVWEAPQSLFGQAEVLGYKLDYRRAGDDDWSCDWMLISEGVDEEAVIVRHLEPLGVYQFRVTARNCFGWGGPSLSSRIVRTHQRGAPKLNTEVLRAEHHLNVMSVPRAGMSMSEIPEMVAEAEESPAPGETPSPRHRPARGVVQLNASDDPETHYQLESEIFRGRFSTVRNAVDRDSESASHCVVKVIGCHNDNDRKRAFCEFEMLRDISHEGVVQLLKAYKRDNSTFLFMERMYETVYQRFSRHESYTEDQIARTIQQVLAAVQWINFQGIVHLEVKPDHVMFVSKRASQVKLIDFGSAIQLSEDSPIPTPENLDPFFTAPELLSGGVVTPAADIWGVGMVAFLLLSGFHPFASDADTEEEVSASVRRDKLDLNLVHTNASEEALRFIAWSLSKAPNRRVTSEEALQHRWLAADLPMARRRENIKFSANRFRKLAAAHSRRRRATPGETAEHIGRPAAASA